MGGDAADEFVRLMLNGTEVAVRLAGSGAKNLAALLIAWSKKEKTPLGKTSMMKLLKSGEELQVLSLTKEQYKEFKHAAGNQVVYAPFMNTAAKDGKIDIVIASRSIPIVNHILKRLGVGLTEPEKERPQESKKKDTPSRQNSEDAKASLQEKGGITRDSPTKKRESVTAKLEANKTLLEQKGSESPARSRQRPVPKER